LTPGAFEEPGSGLVFSGYTRSLALPSWLVSLRGDEHSAPVLRPTLEKVKDLWQRISGTCRRHGSPAEKGRGFELFGAPSGTRPSAALWRPRPGARSGTPPQSSHVLPGRLVNTGTIGHCHSACRHGCMYRAVRTVGARRGNDRRPPERRSKRSSVFFHYLSVRTITKRRYSVAL